MEGDRKYRQNGYNDSRESSQNGPRRDTSRPQGPKPPLDITGPRLPRMVQAVTAVRCYNCATALPPGVDFAGECPKCHAALHCCKQCAYFEPSTRFQCIKPVPARIAAKDQANHCELFKSRMTVARDSVQAPVSNGPGGSSSNVQEPHNPSAARAAFDNLFRKPE
jgi:hypothetical protein